MAQSILDIYDSMQSQLGVDAISFDAGQAAKTPYTTDDLQMVDDQVLTAAKFMTGRGGSVNETKYSDTVNR
jgi:hypothetical protein